MQAYWFLIEYFASNHIDFMWEFGKQPIWHRCCYCCDTEVLVWRCRLCFLQRPNFVLTCQQHNNGFASCVFIWQGLRCCRKLSPVGATWSWSRWCSRRTSLPPPARPSCYIYRVFFLTQPPLKCWPVSNRFQKHVRVPDWPPLMIEKSRSVQWFSYLEDLEGGQLRDLWGGPVLKHFQGRPS